MSSRNLLIATLLASLVLIGVIGFDLVPQLRGPAPGTAEWYWPVDPRPLAKIGPALGFGFLYWVLGITWLTQKSPNGWMIGLLCITHFALQWGIMAADTDRWRAEPLNRTLAVSSNGYFQPAVIAAETDSLGPLLRTYPEAMPQFESEHMQTHPPGLMIMNWGLIRRATRMPRLSDSIAQSVAAQRCTDLWLLNRPAPISAALQIAAWLPMLAAASILFPTFALGRRWLTLDGAKLATLLVGAIPALLLFAPGPDQLFALGSMTLFLCVAVGLESVGPTRTGWLLLSGLILGLLSFLSLGNAALVVPISIWIIWAKRPSWQHGEIRSTVIDLSRVASGVLIIWFGYTALFQVWPWEIAQVGLERHYDLVTSKRSYRLWAIWNGIDALLFVGLPVGIGWIAAAFVGLRQRSSALFLGTALFATVLLLNFSGSSRGEVGRLWLFLMPLWGVAAAGIWEKVDKKWLMGLLAAQIGLALIIGLRWETMDDVIVIAERPEMGAIPAETTDLGIRFGESIQLDRYRFAQTETHADLTLIWSTTGPAARPYTVFNHVLDQNGQLVAQADSWPVQNRWPPTCWVATEPVVDPYRLDLSTLAPGRYTLVSGMYDAQDGARLGEATLAEFSIPAGESP